MQAVWRLFGRLGWTLNDCFCQAKTRFEGAQHISVRIDLEVPIAELCHDDIVARAVDQSSQPSITAEPGTPARPGAAAADEYLGQQQSAHYDDLARAAVRREELANERAAALLFANLTGKQRRQYDVNRYFDVIGGDSGKHYRIWHRGMQNIEELDAFGHRVCVWCVHPVGVAMADMLLAQKFALELFESDALGIAHRYSGFGRAQT